MSYRPRRTHAIPQKWSMAFSGGTPKPRPVPSEVPLTGRTEAPVLPLSASAARGVEAAWQVVARRLAAMTGVAAAAAAVLVPGPPRPGAEQCRQRWREEHRHQA